MVIATLCIILYNEFSVLKVVYIYITVKKFGYFNHITVISVVCVGVHIMKFKECFQTSLLKTLKSKHWEASLLIKPVFFAEHLSIRISGKGFGYIVMVEMPVMKPKGLLIEETNLALGWNFKKPISHGVLRCLVVSHDVLWCLMVSHGVLQCLIAIKA